MSSFVLFFTSMSPLDLLLYLTSFVVRSYSLCDSLDTLAKMYPRTKKTTMMILTT